MPDATHLPAEYEFVAAQTNQSRVLEALRQAGGYSSVSNLARMTRLKPATVTSMLGQLPVRRTGVVDVVILMEGEVFCPTCKQKWPQPNAQTPHTKQPAQP